MLPWKKEKEPTGLDQEIQSLYARMQIIGPDAEEYPKLVRHVYRLETLKAQSNATKARISPDTVLIVLGHLAGIGIVVCVERMSVWTTKAHTVAPPLPKPKS